MCLVPGAGSNKFSLLIAKDSLAACLGALSGLVVHSNSLSLFTSKSRSFLGKLIPNC